MAAEVGVRIRRARDERDGEKLPADIADAAERGREREKEMEKKRREKIGEKDW